MPHTPGPWTIRDSADRIDIRHEAQYLTVASMLKQEIGEHPEAIAAANADAHLIAAAPELLAALVRLYDFEAGDDPCLCQEVEYAEDAAQCPYCEARAAIAKAEDTKPA